MMNYMSSSVSERRREIGILVAIGMDVSQLYKLFISKALILGVVGGLVGFAVGTLISMVAGPQIADTAVSPIFQLLPYSILISTVICIVSSLLPARRAARLDPVEALREV
jgi:putative ABC transport system permease protein